MGRRSLGWVARNEWKEWKKDRIACCSARQGNQWHRSCWRRGMPDWHGVRMRRMRDDIALAGTLALIWKGGQGVKKNPAGQRPRGAKGWTYWRVYLR